MATQQNVNISVFTEDLYDNLKTELQAILIGDGRLIQQAERALNVCTHYQRKLQDFMSTYNFTDTSEEIYYNKVCRPKFSSHSIYYYKLLKIEVGKPVGDTTCQKSYLLKELQKLSSYFEDNRFFYQYVRTSATYLDSKLFIQTPGIPDASLLMYDITVDPSYDVRYDYVIARIIANDLLQEYLQAAIAALENPYNKEGREKTKPKTLNWTESKTGLIELAYALKAIGAFNDGKADVKQIIEFFEGAFSVELGNTSRIFQAILSRKSGYTTFLDRLRERLLARIDGIEQKHIK